MIRTRLVVPALVLALLVAACGGDGIDPSPSAPPASPSSPPASPIPRPSSSAELTVISPANGDVVEGSTVELRIDLRGARIVAQTTTELAPDEGHLHVLLDDELISMTEGLEQSIPDVSPGLHRLTVEFVASDHAPFDPRVVVVVAFEVTA
jgi:hypothetical protein